MELVGTWRAAPADEALRRAFAPSAFDDSAWERVTIPGHWRSTPAFAGLDGPLLYRRRFETPRPAAGRRRWLTLDGVFYDGDVWLDGSYLGATEGYFFPHTFEISGLMESSAEHVLAVEVACAPPHDRSHKRALTGVFQHWDCIDPAWNPGGIWRPVRVEETGPVRLGRLRVLCAVADSDHARLDLRAVLDAATATTALLRVQVVGPDGSTVAERLSRHTLAAGENRIRLPVPIDRPTLWWPHALGDQPLHTVTVEVLVPAEATSEEPADRPARRRSRGRDRAVNEEEATGHVRSDHRSVTTGLRQVRMRNWVLSVNGERLFAKGTNHGPTRTALAEAAPAEFERDVALAREAGLDLLRIHAHITRPELYDAADRAGMLVWQDLPLQWGYARNIRRQAVSQARQAVDLLGHHPSVALWCGHNEPLALDLAPGTIDANPARFAMQVAALQELPTWNKTVLDGSIGRALERADPTRPVVAHSGVWPGPLSRGTDTHLYCGWYHSEERDFPRMLARLPRLARFVTEFGAQAVPDTAEWMDPQRWPDLDWERLEQHHALQLSNLERFVPRGDHLSFDSWREATQAYQATVVRFHVETLRRLKYRPTGGFCHFFFADGQPAVSWSVLDHERRPKAAYRALQAACAPVVVVADRPDASYHPGEELELDVHVVSDLRHPLEGVRVMAVLEWSVGSHTWGWGGDVPADSCVRVGTVTLPVPDSTGPLRLTLTLTGDRATAANEYHSEIVALP